MTRWLAVALVLAAPGVGASELPRLAGTVIAPDQRVALFAAAAGGTVPVGVGETVGDYVVRGIDPGRVELQRAEARVTVSVEGTASALPPVDSGGVTFGLRLHEQGPPDD